MDKKIFNGEVCGKVRAPASKSMMQRAVAAALLAKGKSVIRNPTFCNDSVAAMNAAQAFGAKISRGEKDVIIESDGIGQKEGKISIDCGESGLCIRLFAPIAALCENEVELVAHGSLQKRPVGMMEEPLRALGAQCKTNNGLAPMEVKGKMPGGNAQVDGSESSQFLSGLLMALALCEKDSELAVSNLKSKPYVRMTLSVLRDFGIEVQADAALENFKIRGRQKYSARECVIEGDWSAAAFPLVAGAIAGEVRVEGVRKDSLQADRGIVDALKLAGAVVLQEEDATTVAKANLRAFEFDASDCPDLFPPLVALACNCKGKSVLKGAERLKHKESNRADALAAELGKMGGRISVQGDIMEVQGTQLKGCVVESHNDHRIAMCCAIAALCAQGETEIKNAQCIGKSYPNFFEDLEKLVVK